MTRKIKAHNFFARKKWFFNMSYSFPNIFDTFRKVVTFEISPDGIECFRKILEDPDELSAFFKDRGKAADFICGLANYDSELATKGAIQYLKMLHEAASQDQESIEVPKRIVGLFANAAYLSSSQTYDPHENKRNKVLAILVRKEIRDALKEEAQSRNTTIKSIAENTIRAFFTSNLDAQIDTSLSFRPVPKTEQVQVIINDQIIHENLQRLVKEKGIVQIQLTDIIFASYRNNDVAVQPNIDSLVP